jgi:septal ring factor EnvC (AmiA/AmiB activator)
MTTISKQEAEIAATDKQLAEVNTKLGVLCPAKQEQDETEDDRASAIGQVAVEQTVLVESRKLLEQLLSGIHTAAMDARRKQAQAQVVNNFGGQNEGMQVAVSYGRLVSLRVKNSWPFYIVRILDYYSAYTFVS